MGYEVEDESVFSSDPVDEDVIASRHALAVRKRKMKKIQENRLKKEARSHEDDCFDGSITRIPTFDDESITTEVTFLRERKRGRKSFEQSYGKIAWVPWNC